MNYPISLFNAVGGYTVVWGPEEHEMRLSEGWSTEEYLKPAPALQPDEPRKGKTRKAAKE